MVRSMTQNKDGKFEASNTVVQKLAKNYSSYKYFGAKGLILMAKNFYGLKDSFQATYILDNVIKNFTDFPDVVSEAQTELDRASNLITAVFMPPLHYVMRDMSPLW